MKLLRKVFLCSFLLLVTCYLLPFSASAQEEFTTSYQTTYTVSESGDAQVSQEIALTNIFSTIYATSYTISIEGEEPAQPQAFSAGEVSIPIQTEKVEQKTKLTINFPDTIVGRGKTRNFTVLYKISKFASRNGQVWELAIPKISQDSNITSYALTLDVPEVFGKPAFISPQPKSQTVQAGHQIFSFDKQDLLPAGIVAAFGQFQVFSFDLAYHLQNPYSDRRGQTQIALVPDTAFQRVYYELIDPKPEKIELDQDGNWLATYSVDANRQTSVRTKGVVQLFASPQEHYPLVHPIQAGYYLASTSFWQTADAEITAVANKLSDARAIYDYVVKTLDYNYDKVKDGNRRLGAKQALARPDYAVCTEFTDLFIALSRASGIAAREINGYAYTENLEIQPLSLVADVLHAWPEFWDEQAGIWRPVDPTWGDTTGGVDFFNKFDLAHITFAIHGRDPETPAPAGSYKRAASPQKDVLVDFGQLPQNRTSLTTVQFLGRDSLLPILPSRLQVQITNPGPVALYNQGVAVSTDGLLTNLQQDKIAFLAPFSAHTLQLEYRTPFTLESILQNKQGRLVITVGQTSALYTVSGQRTQLLGLVVIFTVLGMVAAGTFVGARFHLFGRLRTIFARKFGKYLVK